MKKDPAATQYKRPPDQQTRLRGKTRVLCAEAKGGFSAHNYGVGGRKSAKTIRQPMPAKTIPAIIPVMITSTIIEVPLNKAHHLQHGRQKEENVILQAFP